MTAALTSVACPSAAWAAAAAAQGGSQRWKRGAGTRCGAASPFGEGAKKTPFGGTTATSPFGGGGAADPFAAASTSGKKKATTEDVKKTRGDVKQEEAYRAWDDVEVFEVPHDLRRPGKEAVTEHVAFFGLEELFPGTGLEEIFNSDARFRTNIRRAMREDLFVPDDAASEKANAAISSLASSLMVNWKTSPTGYAALSGVFIDHGVENLSGESFIQTLGGLCGEESRGSLIDITGTGRRRERHSWHQDNGLERQFTCMLGFPPESDWEGVGVFSHSAKLSHLLRQDGKEREIIEWEDFKVGDELPVRVIGRPVYSAGHEAGEEVSSRRNTVVVHSPRTHIRGDTTVLRASQKSVSIEPINEFE